jgi:hypothetical protein
LHSVCVFPGLFSHSSNMVKSVPVPMWSIPT